MPVHEIDPWRMQYFAGVSCPAHVHVPTEDSDAWEWNPKFRFVYDKLAVAQSQGLAAGPHGTRVPSFPVFSKPISNLRGMGAGSRAIESQEDYDRHFAPGHFWMALLTGRHVSSDVAVIDGTARWWRHATGRSAGEGTFDHWTVHADSDSAIERHCGEWIARHLRGYSGMINLETIGGTIIEVHLRMTDQWPDLNGAGFVEAVVGLYASKGWHFADTQRRDGYSVVLFGPHGPRYRHPPRALVEQVSAMPHVSSVQITFHEDRDPALHSMPPGGFRLAIVNAWDLAAGLEAREKLRTHFNSA
jgi:hypothetical protein